MEAVRPAEAALAPKTSAGEAETRATGRGGLSIAFAKLVFIVLGFVQQLILQRILGDSSYGNLSRVLSVVGIVNNVTVATALQGVSRSVAGESDNCVGLVFRRTLKIHLVATCAVTLACVLGASSVAHFLKAPQIVPALRTVSLVVLMYGVYAPAIGFLNGRKLFVEQAAFDIAYSLLRTLCMLTLAHAFVRKGLDGALGASAGFALAATLIVPAAFFKTGFGKSGGERPTLGSYLKFLGPLLSAQIFLNLLMQTDSLFLSRFLGQAGESVGRLNDANRFVGYYRYVTLFSFLPYQLLMSVQFIVFPMLARARAQNDGEAIRATTREGLRLSLILTGLLSGVISALAPQILRFAFSDAAAENGGDALRVMTLGMGAFAILGISSAALTGLGYERKSFWLTTFAFVLVAVGAILFVRPAPFGMPMLFRSACTTSAALFVTAAISAVLVREIAGAFAPKATFLRVLLALMTALGLGFMLPQKLPSPLWSRLLVIPEALLVAFAYLGVLVLLREFGTKDLARVQAVIRRKSKS